MTFPPQQTPQCQLRAKDSSDIFKPTYPLETALPMPSFAFEKYDKEEKPGCGDHSGKPISQKTMIFWHQGIRLRRSCMHVEGKRRVFHTDAEKMIVQAVVVADSVVTSLEVPAISPPFCTRSWVWVRFLRLRNEKEGLVKSLQANVVVDSF